MSNQLLASKIAIIEEPPTTASIAGTTTSDCAALLLTERGPIAGSPTLVQSFGQFKNIFGGFTANTNGAIAAQRFFKNGGVNFWVSRTTHFSDPTNAASTTADAGQVTLNTASLSALPAQVTASIAGPYALTSGQTLITQLNGSGSVTTTFTGVAGTVTSSNTAPFTLSDGETLNLQIDGGSTVFVTFNTASFANIAAATVTEVNAVINAAFSSAGVDALATVSTGAVKITSDTLGTGSQVIVVSGGTALTALGFTAATHNGTGNVASIAAVTASEVQTAVVAASSASVTGAVVGGAPQISTVATGGSTTYAFTGGTARTIIGFATTVATGVNSGAHGTLVVAGKTKGAYANNVTVKVSAPTNGITGFFNLVVFQSGVVVEPWANLALSPTDPRYAPTILNDAKSGSNYIAVTDQLSAVGFPSNVPTNGTFALAGGNDGLAGIADADFVGSQAGLTGFYAFDKNQGLRILICPGMATPAIHNGMLTYCGGFRFGSMFAVLDPPVGYASTDIVEYVSSTALLQNASEFGAIYWPRDQIANPDTTVFGNAASIVAAPSAGIAGRYGANDASIPGGIYEAPAGMETAPTGVGWGQLVDSVGLETEEVKDENVRDYIYPFLINPIVGLDGFPIHLDGCKTLSAIGNWPTIGQRRGVIYIEQSLENGLVPYKHRKIKSRTLASINRAIKTFLTIQTNNGAFASDDPKKAFNVDSGAGINTPADAQALTMNARVGLATAYPGEFIVLRVGQDNSLLQTQIAQSAST